MFKIRQPFFQVDESDLGGDWGEVLSRAATDSADEEQPGTDSNAETQEDTEQPDAGTEEVNETDESNSEEEGSADESEEHDEGSAALNDDIEIDLGEGKHSVKLGELKQGYLRQSDYTKKTQALAEERKSFESEKAEYEPLKGMNNFLTANPYLAQQINQFIKEFAETGSISMEDALHDAQFGQHINYWMQRAQAAEKKAQEFESKYGELSFTGTFRELTNDLKSEYGDLVTDEYVESLQKRAKEENLSTTTLRDIAESHLAKKKLEQLTKENQKKEKQTQAKTVQEIQETRRKAPASPKSQGQRPSKDDIPTDGSWFEALRAAAQR